MAMNPAAMRQYQGFPPGQRMAHPPHTPARARGIGPMAQSQTTAAQSTIMRQQNQDMSQQATQRAKKPTDRNMPEGVEELVIGEGVTEYKKTRDFERRLDAVMMRKMLELAEKKPSTGDRRRKLRIWISNTAEGQPWQSSTLDESAFDFSTGTDSRYRVKIVGKLLDEEEDVADGDKTDPDAMDQDKKDAEGESKKTEKPERPQQRLSHFFKAIKIEFDRAKNLQPDQHSSIEWTKPPTAGSLQNSPKNVDFDTIEFERKSDENIQCTINLYRDESPERYAVSKELANIIDAEEASRETILGGIWEYAKAMELQQDEEKRMIQCDDALKSLFQKDAFFFPELTRLIIPHISELPPVKLPYTIRVDADYINSPSHTIYDVLVPAPDLLHAKRQAIVQDPDYAAALRQLAGMDEQLASIIQSVADSKARHSFFTEMSKDPARFIRKWASSQQKDLEVILGDSRYGSGQEWVGEEFRRGGKDGVWGSQNVRESVGLLVATRK